jgi:hypothetical protein
MRFKDLEVGMPVVVIEHGGDPDRPEHWSTDMDEWQGAVVTISDFDSDYVYIKEDEGAWSWYPDDFDPYCGLKSDNPNMQYKRRKQDRRMEDMRKEWTLKQAENKAKKIVNPYASS